MLKNYLTIGLRNLLRNKGYSFINIGGLALGMSVAMLIGLWVHDELTFNHYHKDYDKIGQLMKSGIDPDGTPWAGGTSLQYPLIDVLRTQYGSNFKYLVEALQPYPVIISRDDKQFAANGQYMAKDAPHMLTLEMVWGTRDGLKEPASVMLSESVARKLFGNGDPIGQSVMINSTIAVTVTGVYRDIPLNSRFHELEFIAPFVLAETNFTWLKGQDWKNHFLHIYFERADGKTMEEVAAAVVPSVRKAIADVDGLEELRGQQPSVRVLPMNDWHLRSSFSWPNYGRPDGGPMRMVWLVGIIGGFVLVLACINFMNLSTARSERRAREVGIRKSMGSFRRQLIAQFFAESYLVVILAFSCSLLITSLSLPWFNQLSAKDVSLPWGYAPFWLAITIFIFLTGLLAGSYPALYLSSFNPVKTLKGTFRSGRLASVPRQLLVVLQFTVSVALIISTVVVYRQIMFAKDRPVGYTPQGLLLIQKKTGDFYGKTDAIRAELKKTGFVEELSESAGKIMSVWSNNDGFTWTGKDPSIQENFGTLGVSSEFGSTMKWQFIAGRDFSPDIASDSSALVINEAAARFMGMDHAVEEVVSWKNENWRMNKDFHIIGVIKDMMMGSPYASVQPTVYLLRDNLHWMNIRLKPNVSASVALPAIGSVFRAVIPSAPFEYEFADDAYAGKFAGEERIASLASVFATLAVVISCLGLFGLASFVAEQRTKEIGIRKVIGATVLNLWRMLSMNFVLLVLISSVIAVPITWYGLSSWLVQYQYRVDLSPWVFLLSVGGAVMLTLCTVSYQAIRAARMSPAKSLKTE
ncbi:ABC transporter permease [Chryseolinea sp. T2]|uniref:ABC transporter permease n=1 Tax=Chryseolinea sp. T2 TaxID=3129255 RepID=UPI0030788EDB